MEINSIKENLKAEIPHREQQIEILADILQSNALPPFLYVYGHTSTGKSLVVQRVIESVEHVQYAAIHCIECLSPRFLYESVLEQLGSQERCDNANEFARYLKQLGDTRPICIVLDKAERMRDLSDGMIIPTLTKIPEFTGLNICIIFISEIPFEKFRCGTGSLDPIQIFFPQYSKEEILDLLMKECRQPEHSSLYQTYLSMILGVFLVACRDFCELRYIAAQHWEAFMEPIHSGEIDKTQSVKLWRHLEPKLRSSLNQVYVRGPDACGTQIGLKMELPFFSKFLIIAAYLASYNPPRYDRRLFVKAKEGRKKKDKGLKSLKKQKLHNAARLMGPKVFPIDRLMAIFYSIVEERVTPSLNIFVQISTLVSLKLITHTGSAAMFQGVPKYRCNAGYDLVRSLARTVNFELGRYLYDTTV
ncbi:origin recognition complex subunit 5-like [Daphnia pulex]|uniref:origin recognition complex subunit 5-like n=1 Tax=Daphnia pulex TaxID=6669 RepID=UPI001EE04067|nr:origin recognition complex subunit 5-like [Daphnia pulex]XP_046454959.1 origin recognition complex subunit 5-like [Daphnia pulex]